MKMYKTVFVILQALKTMQKFKQEKKSISIKKKLFIKTCSVKN